MLKRCGRPAARTHTPALQLLHLIFIWQYVVSIILLVIDLIVMAFLMCAALPGPRACVGGRA